LEVREILVVARAVAELLVAVPNPAAAVALVRLV
jgi:hypothetical protein